jgi:yecA family protein
MPDDAMGVEEIDGYFCALVMDAERDWARGTARAILGTAQEASVFESEEQARRAARLVARMWNTVIDRLDVGYAHQPILWGSEAPKAQGWAKGFIAGMQAAHSKWWNAIQSEDIRMFLVPIFGLALDEGEEKEEGLLATPETREEWIASLPTTMVGLYATMWLHYERQWSAHGSLSEARRSDATSPARVAAARSSSAAAAHLKPHFTESQPLRRMARGQRKE